MYVKIENNEIKHRGNLPKSYGNISGFDKLDDAKLAEYGFYPMEVNMPEYDADEQELGKEVVNLEGGKAKITFEVKNLVKKVKDEKIANKKNHLKMMAYQLLKNTDFIMLEDNGLDVNNLAKLKDMRLNLMGLEAKLSSMTKANLKELFNLIKKAAPASEDRFNIFNADMEALANFLETL
jgi:hypothetical protein